MDTTERITARFYKVIYEKGDFLIATFFCLDKGKDGKKGRKFIKVKGYNLPRNKVCFSRLFGKWEENEKYGKTFTCERFELITPGSTTGVKDFFKNSEFDGLGRTIKKVIKKFEAETVKVLSDTPERLNEVDGLSEEDKKALLDALDRVNNLAILTKYLSQMNIANATIRKINDKYGADSLRTVKEQPFSLNEIKGIGFKTCDTIARAENFPLDSIERVECGVLDCLYDNSISGNTYIEDKDLIENSIKKLSEGTDTKISRELVIKAIWNLIRRVRLSNIKNKIFLNEVFTDEKIIASEIKDFINLSVNNSARMIEEISHYSDIKLSEGQLRAVKTSLSSRFSIITGGAGTGKTTVMKAIIYAYHTVNPNKPITLLAPTGKASRRMEEVIGLPASTIHHKIGLISDTMDSPLSKIENGLVIVDEFSMVDERLFSKLLNSVSTSCHIVLVGDPNQLPSIGAGSCLKDMINSRVVPYTTLTEIFRQEGGVIVDNSLKVIKQEDNLAYDKDMMFVNVSSDQMAAEQIKKIYSYYAKEIGIENVALITPLRQSKNYYISVADTLNKELQAIINPSDKKVSFGESEFRLNDRVMMWKNTDIASNGDVGIISNIDEDNEDWGLEITINWENGNVGKYHKGDFSDITLAYAMSVHKSQGSEYDTVIMPVLSNQKCRLFKNNLLYTGITRAKKRVILVGDKSALSTMISNTETYTRKTYLKEFLTENSL